MTINNGREIAQSAVVYDVPGHTHTRQILVGRWVVRPRTRIWVFFAPVFEPFGMLLQSNGCPQKRDETWQRKLRVNLRVFSGKSEHFLHSSSPIILAPSRRPCGQCLYIWRRETRRRRTHCMAIKRRHFPNGRKKEKKVWDGGGLGVASFFSYSFPAAEHPPPPSILLYCVRTKRLLIFRGRSPSSSSYSLFSVVPVR